MNKLKGLHGMMDNGIRLITSTFKANKCKGRGVGPLVNVTAQFSSFHPHQGVLEI
jgi:hypothetical protein